MLKIVNNAFFKKAKEGNKHVKGAGKYAIGAMPHSSTFVYFRPGPPHDLEESCPGVRTTKSGL